MIHKVLVALDGSQPARRGLDLATGICKAFNSELILLHVLSDQPMADSERKLVESEYQVELQEALRGPKLPAGEGLLGTSYRVGLAIRTAVGHAILSRAEETAKAQRVASVKTVLRDGDPASTIVEVGDEERPDLLVLGSRGLGGMQIPNRSRAKRKLGSPNVSRLPGMPC